MSSKRKNFVLKSLARELILHEGINTTAPKAKAVKPFVEKLITKAKENTLISRRALLAKIGSKEIVEKLLEMVGSTFKDRPGGYTRIIRMGLRKGDSSEMVRLELTQELKKKEVSPLKRKQIDEKEKVVDVVKETDEPKVNQTNKTKTNRKRVATT